MSVRTWPPPQLRRLEKALDELKEAVEDANSRRVDEQVWLTRFLVVRTCGYLEQVVHETTVGYIHAKSGGTARAFSLSWLTKSRNPSPENLLDILGRFDLAWRDELESILDMDDGSYRRELALLVGRRHQIAHGLNEGINSRKAVQLVEIARDIADWFIRTLNPYVSK